MPNKKRSGTDIARVAREKLGFETLRPGQKEAVTALLQGHDVLVVQPTGSGKSAIYQIAGLLLEGSTVIVSPLIALQKDQVDSIAEGTAADAVAVNSTKPASELREGMERVEEGDVEFVFLAPEQLRKAQTIENLRAANVSLFVIDEAHCISEWGHDFRPDYLRLGHIVEMLEHPRVLALTATATPRVREEIVERLGMQRPEILVQGFDRPNIYLRVDRVRTEDEKREALLHRVRWADKPGIVYTGTRKAAEEIMQALSADRMCAIFYHGGMRARDRQDVQEKFMSGEADVIVATNAFGMGIDKPDVRFVYHYDPSDSLDAYYQEIGRAGRDGGKAEAILFYRPQDIGAQSFKAGEGKVDPRTLQDVATRIAETHGPTDPDELAEEAGLSRRKMTTLLQRLEDVGAAESAPGGEVVANDPMDPAGAAEAAAERGERLRAARRERLDEMRNYAETTGCRRELVLRYFGDEFQGPCGFCDNCEAAAGNPIVRPSAGTRREVS